MDGVCTLLIIAFSIVRMITQRNIVLLKCADNHYSILLSALCHCGGCLPDTNCDSEFSFPCFHLCLVSFIVSLFLSLASAFFCCFSFPAFLLNRHRLRQWTTRNSAHNFFFPENLKILKPRNLRLKWLCQTCQVIWALKTDVGHAVCSCFVVFLQVVFAGQGCRDHQCHVTMWCVRACVCVC